MCETASITGALRSVFPCVSRKCSTTELTAQPSLEDRRKPLFLMAFCDFYKLRTLSIFDHLASRKMPDGLKTLRIGACWRAAAERRSEGAKP